MISSIMQQSYIYFDLFILDNHSTDNTKQVIDTFSDRRIHYICNEENLGVHGNMNKALKFTNSEYLLITHDDDIMEPDFLQNVINVLDNNPDVSMVSTNINIIDEMGEKTNRTIPISNDIIYNEKEFIKAYLNGENYIACPTVTFRTEALKRDNLKFKKEVGPAADTFFWMEFNLNNKIYVISKPLYNYRVHSSQVWTKGIYDMQKQLYESLIPFLKNNNLIDYIDNYNKSTINNLYSNMIANYFKSIIKFDNYIENSENIKKFRFFGNNPSPKLKYSFVDFIIRYFHNTKVLKLFINVVLKLKN